MKDKIIMGTLYCLVAGVPWGAQFPIAGSALKLIDPFSFTLLRYLAVSLILVALLIIAEGTKALSFEGKAKWVWFFGTMAFTVYNFLVFLGQKTAGPSGAVLASIMGAECRSPRCWSCASTRRPRPASSPWDASSSRSWECRS